MLDDHLDHLDSDDDVDSGGKNIVVRDGRLFAEEPGAKPDKVKNKQHGGDQHGKQNDACDQNLHETCKCGDDFAQFVSVQGVILR